MPDAKAGTIVIVTGLSHLQAASYRTAELAKGASEKGRWRLPQVPYRCLFTGIA